MHHLTRAVGVLIPAVALTVGTLAAADAAEPGPSVERRLDQIALVEDPVPVEESPLSGVSESGRVVLGLGDAAIRLGLPLDGPTQVGHSDGRVVLSSDAATQVAVTPTSTGAQVLVGIESAEAPASFDFDLDAPPGLDAELSPGGTIDIADAAGGLAAQIDSPWAIDAEGRRVPTRFEVRGNTITQVVDHRSGHYAYPIVADPKVKFCDFATAVCVKFSKSETKRAYTALRDSSAKDAAKSVCAIAASVGGPPGVALAAVCVGLVSVYASYLRKKFKSAVAHGKCAETKFRIIGPGIVTAKSVTC